MKPDWAAKIALEKFPGGSDGRTRDIFARALRRERSQCADIAKLISDTRGAEFHDTTAMAQAIEDAIRGRGDG